MKNARKTIRHILFEAKMSNSFIVSKAKDEGIEIQSIQQRGLKIMIHLKKEADDNAIRRFKTQLKIKNPLIDRIEVRQPESPEDKIVSKVPEQEKDYVTWRNKLLTQLKRTATDLGWNLYSNPNAGVNTEYLLLMRGSGPNQETIKLRLSDHPESTERSDMSFSMKGQKNTIKDLRDKLQNKRVAELD